jgi:hypothetical protein
MNTSIENTENMMVRHPLQLGGECSAKPEVQAFQDGITKSEVVLLSHSQYQSQLDRIEVTVLTSYKYKPCPHNKVIGKTPIPSIHDALTVWAEEMDDWHMDDSTHHVSFDQALVSPWCRGYKNKERLVRFLRRVGFPIRYLEQELITQKAFQKALIINQAQRNDRRNRQTRKKRDQTIAN